MEYNGSGKLKLDTIHKIIRNRLSYYKSQVDKYKNNNELSYQYMYKYNELLDEYNSLKNLERSDESISDKE